MVVIRSSWSWVSGFITIFFSLLFHSLASPTLHFCRQDQKDALLEFRDEFPIDESKTSPWNKSSDCCSWKGVTCSVKSGQLPEELAEAEEQMFNWVAAAIAYGPGLYCGLVFGYIYTSHNPYKCPLNPSL
ncbi:PREDICTED: receptor-like protein 12 [Camelina sativa]|uniref:Receptor-like protein 12 n=1 Tax=Camelina sativa TaxID=90675 RepID=A0ABM0TL34_CAMSA|nr:PREDICTED: receptor-like protein 12 [Camelina sativa]